MFLGFLTLLFDAVKAFFGYEKSKSDEQAKDMALQQETIRTEDHEKAEKILREQRALNPSRIDELLKPPSERGSSGT